MDCDYTGPNYSPEDLRSVIDAMCKSLESSGQIDEHEHPSAYSTLLDTAKWMADARPAPAEPVNARLLDALKRAKSALVSFKFVPGCANCWEESDEEDLAAIDSAIAAAEAQQERLLQDMHDAGREIDRMMAEAAPKAARLTRTDIAKALASAGLKPEDYREDGEILPLVIAIESAALRKNGIEAAE